MLFLVFLFLWVKDTNAQTYFPPLVGNQWETKSATDLGWCTDSLPALIDFVGQNNSKAFLVLIDGRIVIEQYYGSFTQDSIWYWASAGKSMLASLVGIAAEEKKLNIQDPSYQYLDSGWTSCLFSDEEKIKIVHQISMSSGLNDNVPDVDCTDPSCLTCIATPGSRWAYHNAVYTLLEEVISDATNQSLNQYLNAKIKTKIGINGLYLQQGFNNVYFSTARSMARFGLLAQNNFVWNGDTVLKDGAFKTQMTNTSQNLNKSYGYLWWLNGKGSFMLPGLQTVFNGNLLPDAPMDLFTALGKNGQIINVIPSKKMVVVRMGNKPNDANELPMIFNNEIWKKLNIIMCNPLFIDNKVNNQISIYPNPAKSYLKIESLKNIENIGIYNLLGQKQSAPILNEQIDVRLLPEGIYLLEYTIEGKVFRNKIRIVQ